MKLKTKMMVLVLSAMTAGFAMSGGYLLHRMTEYALSMAADSEREALSVSGNAFRQVGTREDFERMGEIARDAYLKFQFERCYADGYALLKDGECIKNLTDYEIAAPQALKGEYMVQEIGGRWMLLLKEPLQYPEGFEVLAVKDVTGIRDGIRRQALTLIWGFLGIAAAVSAFAAFGMGRLLRGLLKLEQAAGAIGRGELGRTVDIRSRDEIGCVAAVFNEMSLKVAGQVEDLHVLLGALAHEMKTPVTSIIGYADTLLHVRISGEKREQCLKNIYDAGVRMENMSAKMLALVGMYENGAIERKEISVRQLLERVIRETEGLCEKKKIRVSIDCEENRKLFGDEELLLTLFSNLVHNSVKASAQHGEIRLRARNMCIQVQDFGCGIPEHDLPKVTKAFYMANKSRSRSEGGSGLGLALADRIAALHGAVLTVESEVGVGTVVSVQFKIKK